MESRNENQKILCLFSADVELGLIKEVGDNDLIVEIDNRTYVINLTPEEHMQVLTHISNQENLLAPVNTRTGELVLLNTLEDDYGLDKLILKNDEVKTNI
ncbi:hypothetical protein M3573_18970 [Bacillus safensis]|uniref:hypothetical protein n=1 Tax=Bacillus safensis TaxID=561879 RepID=UPI00203BEAD3|nr:hypothetical protein [Bacillus safensis]MCM3140361.1 hypothetical protein [Bacillus safensis]